MKLLVPIDGSDHSKKALNFALTISKDQNAEIVLLNVQPAFNTPNVKRFLSTQQVQEYQEELSTEAFQKTLFNLNNLGGVHITKRVRIGDPSNEICKEAQEIKASVIIMGNRGLGSFKSALIGSVSYSVIHNATCPVTIVPS
ncbi:universal stress protein [Rossellomorea vietnamensis]|uniref:Universal stress protein n=2 Tax=Rossellomorea TaxID=2837508 RepID=A0A5D4KE57_9BACI|nr:MULTISPECIES: universal stress protein [Rossellomorea]TYR75159.1 universal stress protein [Rossellomorea vietnamensis]TYS79915.1 universal stress protein [Rossellomorea aquimaris]